MFEVFFHTTTLNVSILHFDPVEHRFSPDVHMEASSTNNNNNSNNNSNNTPLWKPSGSWMQAYRKWNNFGESGIPHFETASELHEFNKTGVELVATLEQEIQQQPPTLPNNWTLRVLPFRLLYTAIEVGNVTAWWHIRDANYPGLVIPIQHLPVHDELKMRLQAWRMNIGRASFKAASREAFDQEGKELETAILQELEECGPPKDAPTTMETNTKNSQSTQNAQYYKKVAPPKNMKVSDSPHLASVAISNGS